MKKIFTLTAAVFAFALSASAVTPFKNLYAEATVVPSEAGLVYLETKPEHMAKEVSEDYDVTAILKATIGENGSQDQYTGAPGYQLDASGTLGNYEAKIYIEPAEGYEFVCLSNVIKEDGVYAADNCYQSHTGTQTSDFAFSWEYAIGEANLININSAARGEDANSDNGGIEAAFAKDNWSETPDTKMYVIMRKVGEDLPMFDSSLADGINSVLRPVEDGRAYTISGQVATDATKGIIIKNGKKFIKK